MQRWFSVVLRPALPRTVPAPNAAVPPPRRTLLIPYAILAVSLAATAFLTWQAAAAATARAEARFREATVEMRDAIQRRLDVYLALLLGVNALFIGSQEVTADEFAAYIERLDLAGEFTGIRGIGFIRRIRPDQLGAVTHMAREQVDEDFRIWPDDEREEYYVYVYVEPLDARNRASLGYDPFTDAGRRTAMELARDTAAEVASQPVALVRSRDPAPHGFVIYSPVYGRHHDIWDHTIAGPARWPPPDELEHRRAALSGFVAGIFRLGDIVAGVRELRRWPHIDMAIYDGAGPAAETLLYWSGPDLPPEDAAASDQLEIPGRIWTIAFYDTQAPPDLVGWLGLSARAPAEARIVPLVALAGLALSALVFALTRAQALARRDAETALNELRRSRARFGALIEQVREYAIFSTDTRGRPTSWNQGVLRVLGYAEDEFVGLDFRRLFPPDARRAGEPESELEEAARAGSSSNERWMVRRDQTPFWASGITTAVRSGDGRLLGFTKVMRDMTDQYRAQEALAHSEARFKLVADAAPVFVWLADADGGITWVNRSLFEFTGEPIEAVAGRGWHAVVHPDDLDRTVEAYTSAVTAHEPFQLQFRIRRADGEWRWVLSRGVPLVAADGILTGYIGSAIDVTDQKAIQDRLEAQARALELANAELARSNADLADFAYIAAHDLKEPLRGMSNYAAFLEEDYGDHFDEEGREMLRTIRRLARRIYDLLDSLLEYSRVGRGELALQNVDLNEVCARISDTLRARLEEDPSAQIICHSLPVVRCDPVLMAQVFENLVVNGLKYNNSEIKRVEIGVLDGTDAVRASERAPADASPGAAPDSEPRPIIYIRDNGIGVEPQHQAHIFKMFKRLHGRDQYGGGTGAGLAIVKRIIERHGGRIWLESRPGEGTAFFFTLASNGAQSSAAAQPATETVP